MSSDGSGLHDLAEVWRAASGPSVAKAERASAKEESNKRAGRRLREAREECGWGRDRLVRWYVSRGCECSKQFLSDVEHGRRAPQLWMFETLPDDVWGRVRLLEARDRHLLEAS